MSPQPGSFIRDPNEAITDLAPPAIRWYLHWTDGKQYGSMIELPDQLIARSMLERDVVKAGGEIFGDECEMVGEIIGGQITETIRKLLGVDDNAAMEKVAQWTDAEFEAYLARYEAALASKEKA
jgi:hypothetical protein